jgi:hypothetical protein
MQVFYSFELDDEPNPLTIDETKTIKDFIIQRLSVLADEMTKEELIQIDRGLNAFVVIDLNSIPIGFPFVNYSPSLSQKMRSCFSDQDWNYLQGLLE